MFGSLKANNFVDPHLTSLICARMCGGDGLGRVTFCCNAGGACFFNVVFLKISFVGGSSGIRVISVASLGVSSDVYYLNLISGLGGSAVLFQLLLLRLFL